MTRLAPSARSARALLALPAVASGRDVDVQLLSLNDFHGRLEPSTPGTIKPFDTGSNTDPAVQAGGAEFLASHSVARAGRAEIRCSSRPVT